MKIIKNIYLYKERAWVGDCNSYLIDDKLRTLIDPGNPNYIRDRIEELRKDGFNEKDINLIINTHSHPDHSGANQAFKILSRAKIAMHPEEVKQLSVSKELGREFGMPMPEFKVDFYLKDKLSTGTMEFKILHTPGHSAGSICLYCEKLNVLICGDLIFEGSVGRTDFFGGSREKLMESIEKISRLDIEYLLPGHGNIIKGKANVKRNFASIRSYF